LEDLDFDEVNAILHRVQNFDPSGVAALDLSDCLRLQLQQLPETTPYREEALIVVTQHLKLLATHEQDKLVRRLGVTEWQLDEIVALIRTLDPSPERRFRTLIQNTLSRCLCEQTKWQMASESESGHCAKTAH